MEVLGYHSFPIEVPSPSGSDDSGIGLSPNPPPCDLRACGPYASESPQESHFVSKSFYSGECTEGGTFNAWAYNQQGPDIDASYLNDCVDTKHLSIRNKDNISQEIDSFLESIVIQEKNIANKSNRKKPNSPPLKRLNNVDLNTKQILKLERCLQPKTGNGKPRQTSSKRKMNQTRKGSGNRQAVYPGVRPKTVREVLQHMRQSGGKNPRAPSRAQQQRQMQFPTQNQPVMPPVPQQMQNMPFSPHQTMAPEFMDQFRPTGSPPLRSHLGYPSPASNYSETPPPSYISESSNPQELVNDFCDSNFDNMSIQPNMSPFDHNQMCSAEIFTSAEPSYIHSMSPATTVATVGSPYQSATGYPESPYAIQQTSFAGPAEFNDMQAYVTSQNFVAPQENFPSYSCMSGAPTYESPAVPMMSPYTPVTGAETDENFSFIHQLVLNGNIEELSLQLSRFTPAVVVEQIINSKDDKGMTPLLYAVKLNNIEVASELLKWGADASIPANDGQNVLHFAADLPPNMMSFLAAKAPQFGELVKGTATLKAGRTPLHIATEHKNVMNMILLLSNGASLTAKEQHGGWSALHMAVKNADVKATQEILSFAACGLPSSESTACNKPRDSDALREVVCQRAYNENTALHFAAELQVATSALAEAQSLIINLLMDNEADPAIKNHQNQLPINLLSSANSQLFERLRGGRRLGHSGRPAVSGSKGDLSLPPLRPVASSAAGVRFGGPSSGVPRTTFLE